MSQSRTAMRPCFLHYAKNYAVNTQWTNFEIYLVKWNRTWPVWSTKLIDQLCPRSRSCTLPHCKYLKIQQVTPGVLFDCVQFSCPLPRVGTGIIYPLPFPPDPDFVRDAELMTMTWPIKLASFSPYCLFFSLLSSFIHSIFVLFRKQIIKTMLRKCPEHRPTVSFSIFSTCYNFWLLALDIQT